MVTMLGGYGISEGDLDEVVDHRLIKLAYDYNRLKNRIAKASQTNQDAMTASRKTLATKKSKGHKKPTSTPTKTQPRENLGGNIAGEMQDIEALFDS